MARTVTAARPASREAVRTRSLALGVVAIALLAVAAYASTPFNFWVGDDYNYLGPKGIDRVLSFFDPTVPSRAFYRPLTWTSWAIDYALWGTVPFGWRVSSMLFHTITTLVVTGLVRRLLGSWGVAVLAGALFAVHPSHPETVTWMGGRADLVCGLFYFPSVLLFAMWLQHRQDGRPAPLLYGLALLMVVGAIMGKEMGVTVPLVLLLTDACFFTPAGHLLDISYWRRRILLHLPFLGTVAAYGLMRYYLVASGTVRNTYEGPTIISYQGILDAVTSNLLLLLGVWNGPQAVHSMPNLLKLTIIAAAIALAALAVRWLGRAALYSLLWIVLTALPTYNLSAARWLYIPSFGICLLLALAMWKLMVSVSGEGSERRSAGAVLAGLLLAAWGAGLIYQNALWYRSGEEARSTLAQIKALAPDPPRPATIYFAGAPYLYGDSVYLFNTGLPAAMALIYEGGVELHEVEQPLPDPVIAAALATPRVLKPNPIFLGYRQGKVVRYDTFDALVEAGVGK